MAATTTLTRAFAELLERNAVNAVATAFATCLAVLDNLVADATKVRAPVSPRSPSPHATRASL